MHEKEGKKWYTNSILRGDHGILNIICQDFKGSTYPEWVEMNLKEAEEREVEEKARLANNIPMANCIEDAKKIIKDANLKNYQSDVIEIASSLFDKRASHVAFFKEERCKEKFDTLFRKLD